eukprot:g3952.t1
MLCSFLILSFLGNALGVLLQRYSLENYSKAICTDGSAASYYLSQNNKRNSLNQTWLLYHQGGGWCYDESSCEKRCGDPSSPNTGNPLCSSSTWGSTVNLSGIFEDERFDTLVYIRYCTSDAHMGSSEAFGYHFHGHDVFLAVLDDLVDRFNLGSAQATTIIYGGGSAGARGSMIHLDYVRPRLLQLRRDKSVQEHISGDSEDSSSLRVIGFLDSAFWLDLQPYSAKAVPFSNQSRMVIANFNVTHLGELCKEQFNEEESWKCIFGSYRMNYIEEPFVAIASSFDAFQLYINFNHYPIAPLLSSGEKEYAEHFHNTTIEKIQDIINNQQSQSQVTFLSWSCLDHSISLKHSGYFEENVNNHTMKNVLGVILNKANNPRKRALIDSCDTVACGSGCR